MTQPPGFENGDLVCKLGKAIYGLKQSGRQWNAEFVSFLQEYGLRQTFADSCVFRSERETCIVAIYVDDGLVCTEDQRATDQLLHAMKERFKITVVEAKKYVGLEIGKLPSSITLSQSMYIEEIARKFNTTSRQVATPLEANARYEPHGVGGVVSEDANEPHRELIGAIMYVGNATRPDVTYAVCTLARYCASPKICH